ncbi:hypothetical protein DFP72DRAFT_1101243 [Ephemerocybe angulata]|uniref:DUF6589 domain-containing protein n=1 Tax=Ephemerocybe angulata TaxID=980116 RepID=A0A8H6HA54_9AGAR|nr:hypothetical protein DFP72DRAFT_1101243 [Tulosesus angulatus]
MFFNPRGRIEDFKPTDIRVEHLNDRIKERAHGANATPAVLEKIVPAMGHVQNLTDKIFEEMGIEELNQRHTHVGQEKDIIILVNHLRSFHPFDFTKDQPSPQAVVNLYHYGLQRLAGSDGGHRRHLARHKLRLRERHSSSDTNIPDDPQDQILAREWEHDLGVAADAAAVDFTLGSGTGQLGDADGIPAEEDE